MKFIHTADWQIGMRATGLGPAAAAAVRRARLESARRVVLLAGEEKADFLVLAGDTFEHNAVSREHVREVVTILSQSSCPVFVLPGNHDPLCSGSVWEMPEWTRHGNITVLSDSIPLPAPGCTLLPCPLREAHGTVDPTAWIPPEGHGIRIGVAHGSVEGLAIEDPQYPIPRDAPQRRGLDFLALGHWHSFGTVPPEPGARIAYSGTHEPTRFGERDSGNALIVEIESKGAAPAIRSCRTGALTWYEIDQTLAQEGDCAALWRRIEAVEGSGSALLRVRVRGVFSMSEIETIHRIRSLPASDRFLYAEIQDQGLAPLPADEAWLETIPDLAVREAARRIAGETGDTVTAAVRRQALVELYLAMQEVFR